MSEVGIVRRSSVPVLATLALVVLVAGALGCEGSPAGARDAAVIEVLDVSLVLDGSDEALGDEPLAQIRAAAVVDDTTIAIFDGITNRVTIVRRSSGIVGRFGGPGAGPGEFRSVSDLDVRDGLVFAYDQQLRRVTAFELSGEVRSSSATRNRSQLAGRNFRVLGPDRYAIRDLDRDPSGTVRIYYSLSGPDATDARDLAIPPQPGWEGLPAILEFPLEPHVVSSLCSSGDLYFARTDRYEILVSSGERMDTIVGHRDPVSILPAERENYQAWADFVTGGGAAEGTRTVPQSKPLLRGLWCASDGTLVVELHSEGVKRTDPPAASRLGPGTPRLEWSETPVYDLFDPDGSVLGRLSLPLRSRILDVKFPSVWVARLDSLGVPLLEHWTVGQSEAHDGRALRPVPLWDRPGHAAIVHP